MIARSKQVIIVFVFATIVCSFAFYRKDRCLLQPFKNFFKWLERLQMGWLTLPLGNMFTGINHDNL